MNNNLCIQINMHVLDRSPQQLVMLSLAGCHKPQDVAGSKKIVKVIWLGSAVQVLEME